MLALTPLQTTLDVGVGGGGLRSSARRCRRGGQGWRDNDATFGMRGWARSMQRQLDRPLARADQPRTGQRPGQNHAGGRRWWRPDMPGSVAERR